MVVKIVSTKWDGGPHRDSEAVELGEDRHGLWAWMPENTPVATPAGTYLARPGLRLFPAGAWWSAYFVPQHTASGRLRQWYIDIATPAVRRGELITFVDLDLDVQRLGDGAVTLLDEEEFEQNRESMAYPDEIATRARHAAAEMLAWMASGAEPFGAVSEHWLRLAHAE